ncbi:MAG: hypothetical protein LUD48_05650, partial [Prevotella sp.]|nr:hypothetical protein [Prevotella sp.]
ISGDDGTTVTSINGSATEIPDTGTVYNFYAKEDGYLYVLAKLNTAKVILVWEDGTRIPYLWTASDDADGGSYKTVSFDLCEQSDILDEDGNISSTATVGFPYDYISFSTDKYSADCQAGVIKIAVTKEKTYTVCACGSKMAVGGYYFDTTGTATITYTYNVTDENDNVTASYPFTLLENGQIPVTEPDPVTITISSKSSDLTDGATLSQLSDGDDYGETASYITVTAENMDQYDDPGIYLDITYEATEDEDTYTAELTNAWLKADEDGNYTWTCGYAYELTDGVTYTFTITPLASSSNPHADAIGDPITLTITGSYTKAAQSSVEFSGVTPSTEEETIYSNQNEITLTFSGDVASATAQMYYGKSDGYKDIEADSVKVSGSTVTICLTDDQMSTAVTMNMLWLMVTATDSEGLTISYDGEDYILITYSSVTEYTGGDDEEQGGDGDDTTKYDEVSLTYSPKSGAEIYGNLTITATYKYSSSDYEEGTSVYLTPGEDSAVRITDEDYKEVTDADGNVITASLSTGDDDNQGTIEFSSTLPAGTYKVILDGQTGDNGEAFYVEVGDDYTKVAVNAADTLTYTITDDLSIELTSDDLGGASTDDLSNAGEIYIETNSLDELYVTLTITDTPDEGDATSTSYDMTYEESDNDYVWSCEEGDIILYSGHSYTFTVNAYSSKDDTETPLATKELYTITGTSGSTVTPTTIELEITPTTSAAEFTADEDATINVSASDYVTIVATIDNGDDDPISLTPAVASGADTDGDYSMGWTITIGTETLAQFAGSEFTINITATNATNATASQSLTYSVASSTVTNPDEGGETELSWTFSPADSTTILTSVGLSSITISCTDGIKYNKGGEITITDSLGVAVDGVTISCDISTDEDADAVTSCTLTLSSTITEVDRYIITIPEGYFLVGEDMDENPETTLTYIVSTTTGINAITLRATSDDRFYNLNGQRVTTPRNGIFILNGKKVLVK